MVHTSLRKPGVGGGKSSLTGLANPKASLTPTGHGPRISGVIGISGDIGDLGDRGVFAFGLRRGVGGRGGEV